MSEVTINERLKFLIEKFGMSVRAFSTAIGATDTNTRNYIDRGSKPNAEYLGKLLKRFNNINPTWLLLGEGDPFVPNSPASEALQIGSFNQTGTSNKQTIKNNKGNVIGTNHGTATQSKGVRDVFISHALDDKAHLEALVEQLRSQLADKERIIKLLEQSLNKPS
jgi:hypothetical protein